MKLRIWLSILSLLLLSAAPQKTGPKRGETVWQKDCAGIVSIQHVVGEINIVRVTCEKLP